ncbi:hypothetical protein B0A50_08697 [Salinomyces thailandicus]|uniref:Uncharacterized protein n=1 Tax=Salinomyces thailandicus TaxID=706561 RepID=A0A4U0TJ62_9PEZI|nr:hypothetical protein B0A50_08697 [Salinomyces thailandica]
MSPKNQLPLAPPPKGPIAIRPEYLTHDPTTTLHIKEHDYSLSRRDFSARDAHNNPLMTASGKTLSTALRREFLDPSGLPLFELRKCSPTTPSKARANPSWSLALPGHLGSEETHDEILTATFKPFWIHPKLDLHLKNLAPPSHTAFNTPSSQTPYAENVVLQVRGQDASRLVTHVLCEGRKIMHVRRAAEGLGGAEGVYPHGIGYKPEWEVEVAEGVDVCLAVVVVVILAEHRF